MSGSEYKIKRLLRNLENLYDKDPDRFENIRQEIITSAIKSYPEEFQFRARGIQCALDRELNKYKNPVVRMNRMVELFWDKAYEFQTVISDPVAYSNQREKNKQKCEVIPLHRTACH